MVSFHRKYVLKFLQTGSLDVSAFFHQENSKLHLFILEQILLHEQASSHTSCLKALFLLTLIMRFIHTNVTRS